MDALALVLDQGGHSSRGLVFDTSGRVVATAAVPINTTYPAPSHVEQDPLAILASLQSILTDIAQQLGARCAALQSAALIVQRSSLLAWDRVTRKPLSPVLSWQDTRHAVWLETLLVDRRAWLRERTGLYPNAHYGVSKMCWLLEHDAAVKTALASGSLCIGPLASFLQQQLTASAVPLVDAVIASRTLLTDLGELAWSPALLDFFAIPAAILPDIRPTMADYGVIRLGQYPVPLRLLGGDQSFFALSHDSLFNQYTVMTNAGTGAFLQQSMPAVLVPERLLCAPLLLAAEQDNSVLVAEGTVNAAASALDWYWQQIGRVFSAGDWQAAETAAASGVVPVFLNRVTASGSPDWLPAGDSLFSVTAEKPLMALAVLESIVFALQRNLDVLRRIQHCERIVLSGGLAQLDVFCQRMADLARVTVMRSEDVEACARGAAMQLLPGVAGSPHYQLYHPRPCEVLDARYRQWTAVLDQCLPKGG